MYCVFWGTGLFSEVLRESGLGESESAARSVALANLSQRLFVNVNACITELSIEENKQSFAKTMKEISLQSNLPLLGIDVPSVEKVKGAFKASVIMDPQRSLPLYALKLKTLQKQLQEASELIPNDKKDSSSTNSALRYEQLLLAKARLDEYEIHRYIYLALGGKEDFASPITESRLNAVLYELSLEFDDLTLALRLSVRSFGEYKGIYVYYPTVYPSRETTQLARVIRDHLLGLLPSTDSAEGASYYLRTSYEIVDNGILLNLKLSDKAGNILRSNIVKLKAPAYQSYEYIPKSIDLAEQIASGELVSNRLQVQFSGLEGNDQLFYTKGEEIGFKIKSNLPIEYFIVVHTYNDDGIYSYLLRGDNDIHRISSDQCNRWVELPDSFIVGEPFGVEVMQVFASTGSLTNSLPPVVFDERYKLYKISNDPKQAVALTRGLRPKAKAAETTETSLTLTTMEK